jgi:Domain of unknown function (DUF5625)
MSKEEPVMRSRRVLTAVLALMPWLAKTAFGNSLPTPVTRVNFEVSRKRSAAVIGFRINRRRPYFIALQFNYVGRADSDRVLGLVEYPGITIPIHLRLLRLEERGGASTLVFDDTVMTKDYYAHGFDKDQSNGNFRREILTIGLEPGVYRVEARTLDDSPAFAGTPSYLRIDYRGKY